MTFTCQESARRRGSGAWAVSGGSVALGWCDGGQRGKVWSVWRAWGLKGEDFTDRAPWDDSTAETRDPFEPVHDLFNKSFCSLAATVLRSWAGGWAGGGLEGRKGMGWAFGDAEVRHECHHPYGKGVPYTLQSGAKISQRTGASSLRPWTHQQSLCHPLGPWLWPVIPASVVEGAVRV